MARRKSLTSVLNQIARDTARNQRAKENEQRRLIREMERAKREELREKAQADKEYKHAYIEARIEETKNANDELEGRIFSLTTILDYSLSIDSEINFDSLRMKEEMKPFEPPSYLNTSDPIPEKSSFLGRVKSQGLIGGLLPGAKAKYEKAIRSAEQEFDQALREWKAKENERIERINKLKEGYDQRLEEFNAKKETHNLQIDEFEREYLAGNPESIVSYNSIVLERSLYPHDFPKEFRLAYIPESRELVIEYELPRLEVIPTISEFRFVKTKDVIEEKLRKQNEIKEIYQDIVASICLRTIKEVLLGDQNNLIDLVVFNGFVQAINPATGKDIRPYLISVRTNKERFAEIDLGRVEKFSCLRNLGAQVSPRPAEMQAVKPIIEFNMVDKRFIEQSDILSDLESRPNLMELNPFEFENLVSNLFQTMGLETRQTRTNRDNGVDAIAFDPRPILGGKVVVQAKRYKNVVGVSAVRDLYGTMMNEGANKGILVSTSHYGPDAYEFARDKPIELIDGGGLLYLLMQTGVEARIIFPDD